MNKETEEMVEIVTGHTEGQYRVAIPIVERVPRTDPRVMAYHALEKAATKIGLAGYNTSDEIGELQEAMSAVLGGEITPEEAMALLHYGETGEVLKRARQKLGVRK